MRKSRGHNLFELFTVVAVVGIISIVAMSAYHANKNNARFAEGTVLLEELKDQVEIYVARANAGTAAIAQQTGISSYTFGRPSESISFIGIDNYTVNTSNNKYFKKFDLSVAATGAVSIITYTGASKSAGGNNYVLTLSGNYNTGAYTLTTKKI